MIGPDRPRNEADCDLQDGMPVEKVWYFTGTANATVAEEMKELFGKSLLGRTVHATIYVKAATHPDASEHATALRTRDGA